MILRVIRGRASPEQLEMLRAALQERTRERVPLDWASTQHNLGTALHALGEREPGTARLTHTVGRTVLRIEKDAKQPLHVLVLLTTGDPLKQREPGERLRVRDGGSLRIFRFPPEAAG